VALRDDPRVRALAVGSGLIPPRTMHTAAEAALLRELARGCGSVVEIGVYEGSSAVVLVRTLGRAATLHLIDPFGHQPGACAQAGRRPSGPRAVWWRAPAP